MLVSSSMNAQDAGNCSGPKRETAAFSVPTVPYVVPTNSLMRPADGDQKISFVDELADPLTSTSTGSPAAESHPPLTEI
jgi:hypothetical protein